MTVDPRWMEASASAQGPASKIIPVALTAGDVYVAVDIGNYSATSEHGTVVSGLGATWTQIGAAQTLMSEVWVGVGNTNLPSSQTVTLSAPLLGGANRRRLIVYCFRNISSTVAVAVANATSATATTANATIGPDQAAIAFGYSDTAADSLKSLVPGTGWATITNIDIHTSTRFGSFSHRVPSTSETHRASASRTSGATMATLVTLGDPTLPPLTSTFVGWGNPIF